ncbi:NAD-dependent epimerase/dehydratase family protein [Metabacillus litoralis]|uniref:NAD-dependent epimerase/dehydratase family protein n=1 Tax=Metabacillus litoralis TaxID=152268 RepID=UPI001CFD6C3C|nr:NAD(P)-dependent oxidoreductase [Metabacillus litoralis]
MTQNTISNKKILVTGGYGFIGSHLINRIYKDCEVAVFTRNTSNPWRVQNALPHIQTFTGDISICKDIQNAVEKFQPHVIFHLAAYGVNNAKKNCQDAIKTNIQGTANTIISAQYSKNIEKIINLGSSSEYGDKDTIIHEEMMLKPLDLYGSTKASATLIGHQLASQIGINMITFRPFNLYGEMEESHKLFSYVIQQILKNNVVLLTPCEQLRDYCYIQNLIDAFILAISNQEITNEIFNIGSGEVHPIKYFIDTIFAYSKTDLIPQYGALTYRENERMSPQPDISKIKQLLNWQPNISFQEGINRTINWYKQNYVGKGGGLINDR